VPVAYVHGARDRLIPVRDAEELVAATPGRKRFKLVPEMGHAFDPLAIVAIRDAVEWVLRA
jgi:fermentation-respiration switch protein FrsA (DUF1100 family)